MITDMPLYQQGVAVESEGGSARPGASGAHGLPPLPYCKDHPRRALELFCKSCEAAMCLTCKETDHLECQKAWDENCAMKGLPRSIFCEGVEKAAARLKDEVLGGLCAESVAKEAAVREAAELVLKRMEEVSDQFSQCKAVLKAARERLLRAVNERFDKLEALLEAAALEKQEALLEQNKGLEAAALGLKQAKEGAEETLGSLVVEERPVEIVEACLRLKQELLAIHKASQASAPVRKANLHVAIKGLKATAAMLGLLGWAGAQDADPARCSFVLDGVDLHVEPSAHFSLDLITRDSEGEPLATGGLAVAARVCPEEAVKGDVIVRDNGDGTYTIGFTANDLPQDCAYDPVIDITVETNGVAVQGCPIKVARGSGGGFMFGGRGRDGY